MLVDVSGVFAGGVAASGDGEAAGGVGAAFEIDLVLGVGGGGDAAVEGVVFGGAAAGDGPVGDAGAAAALVVGPEGDGVFFVRFEACDGDIETAVRVGVGVEESEDEVLEEGLLGEVAAVEGKRAFAVVVGSGA